MVELHLATESDRRRWHLLDGDLEEPEHVHEDDEEMGNGHGVMYGLVAIFENTGVDVVPREKLQAA